MVYKDLLAQATEEFQENKKLVQKFKKSNHRDLDNIFHKEHDKIFKKINCLACANCCKTTSPIFRDVDIKRIALKLRIPIGKFIDTYRTNAAWQGLMKKYEGVPIDELVSDIERIHML